MNIIKEKIYIILLSVGILLTMILVIQEYSSIQQGCLGIRNIVESNCSSVIASDPLKIIGLSSSLIGLIYFGLVLTMTFWVGYTFADQVYFRYRRYLLTLGLAYSIGLTMYQMFYLDGICIYCLGVFSIVVILFLMDLFLKPKKLKTEFISKRYLIVPLLIVSLPFILFGGLRDRLDLAFESKYSYRINLAEKKPEIYAKILTTGFHLGNKNADIKVIEYFDPLCSHCKNYYPHLKNIITKNSDDIHFILQPFILNESSRIYHNAIYTANMNNELLAFLDQLFLNPSSRLNSKKSKVKQYLENIGLYSTSNMSKIIAGKYDEKINEAKKLALKAGIRSTPTIIYKGKIINNYNNLKKCIEKK